MLRSIHLALGAAVIASTAACSSYPAPNQRMADAVATSRAAQEVGANTNPQAQLHLRLANEEIERAKRLMEDGDNKRADFVLVRAKADADLALAEAREVAAERDAKAAVARADALQSELQQAIAAGQAPAPTPIGGSSVPVGTTTTTGSTVPGPVQQPAPVVKPRSEGGAR
ncbi:DUF4398 domain-containing protein [Pendulispora albinea]|uniref:DUF4398 domain-containing protein n=1 Tax=Pendulispora albinea TaxID=2741071 RepID=A0ABZ2LNW8_9BACT